jgi:predicted negative regulator of RcsB-dependent stress response
MRLLALAALSVGLELRQSNDCDTLAKCQEALKTNRISSLAHFRICEIYFLQADYVKSINECREVLDGDLNPKWTEVWAHVDMGKIYDAVHTRDRALNEYRLALRTEDNTRGALDEARKYTETPYSPK